MKQGVTKSYYGMRFSHGKNWRRTYHKAARQANKVKF